MSGRSWLYGEVLNLPATGDAETEATEAHASGVVAVVPDHRSVGRFVSCVLRGGSSSPYAVQRRRSPN
jgi:hypothetical protein